MGGSFKKCIAMFNTPCFIKKLFRSLQELFMGPAISSSAFWVSKRLRALKILSAISALYNQKYCYVTSGIYDNVIYPPSYAGVLFRGRWAQGCHNVWYTLQNHQTVTEEGREENALTPSDLCWWGGGSSATILSQKIQKKSYSFESITGNFQLLVRCDSRPYHGKN